jgi:molybdenum cofactor cytidylyltransferase
MKQSFSYENLVFMRKEAMGEYSHKPDEQMTDSDPTLQAVILAAGRSTRMGRPKMLMPWGKTTVIGQIISQWRVIGARVAVVISNDKDLSDELDRLGISQDQRIVNPEPEHGMFSSILCAARWPRWRIGAGPWAIVLGDQPHLSQDTLGQLIRFWQKLPDKICQPEWHGRPKHPVILPRTDFLALRNTVAADLKDFLRGREVDLMKSTDAGLESDLDFPEDYERLHRMHFPDG